MGACSIIENAIHSSGMHLKLDFSGFVVTCAGIIIRRGWEDGDEGHLRVDTARPSSDGVADTD